MFNKKRAYLISIPGANKETVLEIEGFFTQHQINAKIIRNAFTIHEIEK